MPVRHPELYLDDGNVIFQVCVVPHLVPCAC